MNISVPYVDFSAIFRAIVDLFFMIYETGVTIWNFFMLPLNSLPWYELTAHLWLPLDIISQAVLGDTITDKITLIGLLFGVGLTVILVGNFVKWVIGIIM